MENPTHFIEVYKTGSEFELTNCRVKPISRLDRDIDFTKKLSDLKTIAVWKIKKK